MNEPPHCATREVAVALPSLRPCKAARTASGRRTLRWTESQNGIWKVPYLVRNGSMRSEPWSARWSARRPPNDSGLWLSGSEIAGRSVSKRKSKKMVSKHRVRCPTVCSCQYVGANLRHRPLKTNRIIQAKIKASGRFKSAHAFRRMLQLSSRSQKNKCTEDI